MSRRRLAILSLVLGIAVAAGCEGGDDWQRAAAPARPDPDATVVLKALEFEPSTTKIRTGQTVAWRWDKPAVIHDVAFDDGPASPRQQEGTWERTFGQLGEYDYVCTVHPQMTGTVIVGP